MGPGIQLAYPDRGVDTAMFKNLKACISRHCDEVRRECLTFNLVVEPGD